MDNNQQAKTILNNYTELQNKLFDLSRASWLEENTSVYTNLFNQLKREAFSFLEMIEKVEFRELRLSHMEMQYAREIITYYHKEFKQFENQEQLYKEDGILFAKIGLTPYMAHYPNDTFVGRIRLEGFMNYSTQAA